MKKFGDYEVLSNKKITSDIFDMTIMCPEIAEQSNAGQFVNVYLAEGEHVLPRPISICETDKQTGILRIVFRTMGKGTEIMSRYKEGDYIRLLGPLGNSFDIAVTEKRIAIIGGGIGAPPLLELAKQIRLANPACEIHVFLGFRTEPILIDDFEKYGAVMHISTDDGSVGFHGTVTGKLNSVSLDYEMMYACGPKVMLKSVAAWAKGHDTKLFVSLEERMACGIGACLGCVTRIKTGNNISYKEVCSHGTVFSAEEVYFE